MGRIVALGALIAISVMGSARAESTASTTPVAKLTVDVRARIPERCGFSSAPESPTQTPNVNVAHTLNIPFKLDCNTPFVIGVKSSHGALASDLTSDAAGFALTKAYKVALLVGTDGSALAPDDCDSQALTAAGEPGKTCAFYGSQAGEGLSSDKAISLNKPSQLTVSWVGAADGAPRNVAGHYQDTITVIVAAQL